MSTQSELIPPPKTKAAPKFDRNWAYWYARGYHDGRCEGRDDYGEVPRDYRSVYREGYDAGVADYSQEVDKWDDVGASQS